MKKALAIGISVLALAGSVFADSLSSTGTTSTAVIFGPKGGYIDITSVDGYSDLAAPVLAIQQRTGPRAEIYAPSTIASGATNFSIKAVSGLTITNGDVCVIAHANGFMQYVTIEATGGVIGTNINLAAGSTVGQAITGTNDTAYIYEMANAYISRSSAMLTYAGNTNSVISKQGAPLFRSKKDSPVRVSYTGTAISQISATSNDE